MDLRFEWDEEKARRNLLKHGVSFEEGRTVFRDEAIFTTVDEEHSEQEDRYISIGMSSRGRLLLVSHTDTSRFSYILIRIISCRRLTPAEQRRYGRAET